MKKTTKISKIIDQLNHIENVGAGDQVTVRESFTETVVIIPSKLYTYNYPTFTYADYTFTSPETPMNIPEQYNHLKIMDQDNVFPEPQDYTE